MIGAALVTGISGFMTCYALFALLRAIVRMRRFVRVSGHVVEVRAAGPGNLQTSNTSQSYAPVLAFRTVEGRNVQTISGRYSNRYADLAGQQVSVVYDPRNPTEAYLGTATGTPIFVLVLAVVIVGSIFLVGATVLANMLG